MDCVWPSASVHNFDFRLSLIGISATELVSFQQIMATFAADAALHEAVALRATLRSQGNFSLRAGADHHFNSFLKLLRLVPGSKVRGKLAK